MTEEIKLYNTLGRKIEKFIPIVKGKVGIYTCGPTVYSRAHIGNLKTYISADTIRRTLEYAGYEVKQVMNITDVGHLTSDSDTGEDKLQKAAKETKQTAWEISKKWTEQFIKDITELNIEIPTIICKATDNIKEQINLVKKLEKKGYTYKTSDGIYFDTSKFPKYSELGKLNIEGLQTGKRIDFGEKKNKTDFALWKFSNLQEKRDMEWDSPWGVGFPGWHIECSAMSMKYLGETFDIHTGGVDHIPIHHTNEIAQAECATGKKFVNYWMHSEFLVMNDSEKMSKSSGNVLSLDTLKEYGISPLDYRYFCLNTSYRKQLNYSKDKLQFAKKTYENLTQKVINFRKAKKISINEISNEAKYYLNKFKESVFDDLNIPQALGTMWNLIKDEEITDSEKYSLLINFDKVLGLNLDKVSEEKQEIPQEIINLAKERLQAKKEKNWKKSDELRNKILELGFIINDEKFGYTLTKK